jgi:two-component system OmpR family response regulator
MEFKNTNKQILLAEGFAPSREIMTQILTILGYDFVTVSTGYEVILTLKKERFDLILLDLELPEFDGFETIEHIRRNMNFPENATPVLAMTNKDFSSEFSQTYKDEGFDGVIVKPFSLDDLDKTIQEVLNKKTATEKVIIPNRKEP